LTELPLVLELSLEGGLTAFEPGTGVAGVAAWSSRVAPKGMELRLTRSTRGPGGRDFKIADTLPFREVLATDRRPFIFTLPRHPYTFRGRLLSLVWTLELVALPTEEKTAVELTIAPGRQAVDLTDGEVSAS
jgi:hypothetical protein